VLSFLLPLSFFVGVVYASRKKKSKNGGGLVFLLFPKVVRFSVLFSLQSDRK
jgi:hypothetical protein